MRLIDAEALLEKMEKVTALNPKAFGTMLEYMRLLALDCVKEAPTIEAKPVVHAHWESRGSDGECCSNCSGIALFDTWLQSVKTKYCPYCGAQMDELVRNTDELNGSVKIPVISMEDVPKVMEEMEK